jgi:hypothetical protein
VEAGRHDRSSEAARPATAHAGRKGDRDQHAVGGQEEAGEDRDGVERPAGEVRVRAQLGEVVVPPRRIVAGEQRQEHADREREHCELSDAVRDDRRVGMGRRCVSSRRVGVIGGRRLGDPKR